MNRFTQSIIGLFVLYVAICVPIMVVQLQIPPSQVFVSDAGDYHNGAANLVNIGMYSVDGEHPFLEREPGQSVYLAVVYRIFGIGNRLAVFLIQMLVYFAVSLLLIQRLRRMTSDQTALITFGFLLLLPSIYHTVFSFDREWLTLTLWMLVVQAIFSLMHKPTWLQTVVAGAALGFLLITYSPFVYLPIVFLPFLLWLKIPWKNVLLITLLTIIPVLSWAVRNERITHQFCLTRCNSTVQIWYVRGEQAEHLSGTEPIMCLWAEYVSRDWSNRSPDCSFNHVKNARWPNGVHGTTEQMKRIGEAGIAKIKAHFGNYLWFSVFEVLELHLPYLGWGRIYNVLASIGQLFLYIGCIGAVVGFVRKKIKFQKCYLVPLVLMAYTTAVFIATDATPRYLMPVIFCYCLFAGVGYGWMVKRKA